MLTTFKTLHRQHSNLYKQPLQCNAVNASSITCSVTYRPEAAGREITSTRHLASCIGLIMYSVLLLLQLFLAHCHSAWCPFAVVTLMQHRQRVVFPCDESANGVYCLSSPIPILPLHLRAAQQRSCTSKYFNLQMHF